MITKQEVLEKIRNGAWTVDYTKHVASEHNGRYYIKHWINQKNEVRKGVVITAEFPEGNDLRVLRDKVKSRRKDVESAQEDYDRLLNERSMLDLHNARRKLENAEWDVYERVSEATQLSDIYNYVFIPTIRVDGKLLSGGVWEEAEKYIFECLGTGNVDIEWTLGEGITVSSGARRIWIKRGRGFNWEHYPKVANAMARLLGERIQFDEGGDPLD